jgi:hypothetical protein
MTPGLLEIKSQESLRVGRLMIDLNTDVDFCAVCERTVPEGSQHDVVAHQGDVVYALELARWKEQLHRTSLHQ